MTDSKAEVLRAIAESYVEWRKRSDTPTLAGDTACPLCVYCGDDDDTENDPCALCPVHIYSGSGCVQDYDFDGYRKMMRPPIAISRAKLYAEKVANKLLKLWFMVLEDDRRWR